MNIQLNANFQALDIADPWKYQRKFLQADLFTLSYFVSEVYALDASGAGKLTAFWQELFGSAKPGAMFITLITAPISSTITSASSVSW
jgi:hypothetical protein